MAGSLGSFCIALALLMVAPLPASAQVYKILTTGDSITAGFKYQLQMKALLDPGGYSYQFVGSLGAAPNQHEGHSGQGFGSFNDGHMTTYLNSAFGTAAPPAGTVNVVTLLLGVNNMNHGLGVPAGSAYPDGNGNGTADAAQFANPIGASYLNGLGASFGDSTYGTGWCTTQVNTLVDTILNHPSQPKLVIAKIAPIGKGNPSYTANNDNCALRIAELNSYYQNKYDSLDAARKARSRIVDCNTPANRIYGTVGAPDYAD